MQVQSRSNRPINFINDLLFKDEVFAIIGAAIEVHKILGSGFLESVYQEAFEIELESRQIPFSSQSELAVCYKNRRLQKTYRADLVVYSKIIVEIKANEHLNTVDEAQLINYLKATSYKLGLLINFGSSKLEWKRMIFEKGSVSTPTTNFQSE